MDLNKHFGLSINAIKNLSTWKTAGSIKSFYDARYPLTKFLKPQQSKIFIHCIMCGFPRAGTHWIRNVVENSTCKKTYNLFQDKPSLLDQNVILIKIHARNKFIAHVKALWLLPPFDFGGKYIYVYRDPRDAIISLYEMTNKEKKLDTLEIDEFLKIYDPIRQYRWEIGSWVLRNHDNVLLVKFEDLKLSPNEEFHKIFRFLELDSPVANEAIGEMVATSDSKNRPRGVAYGWKKVSSDYKKLIDTVTNGLEREIKMLGYE